MVTTETPLAPSTDLTKISTDVVPDTDDTRDLGSNSKRWAAVYAVLAVLSSIMIGGVLFVENSGIVSFNGTLNGTFIGDGSGLTGINGSGNGTDDWNNFINVPSGFADNVDNDTEYSHLSNFTDDINAVNEPNSSLDTRYLNHGGDNASGGSYEFTNITFLNAYIATNGTALRIKVN